MHKTPGKYGILSLVMHEIPEKYSILSLTMHEILGNLAF